MVNTLCKGDSQILDGMDIALCIIDKDKKKLQYAGANNLLYIVRGKQLIKVRTNKYAIGLTLSGSVNKFTNHEVELQKGDSIYLFSDGYADQFGVEGEKFMYARFRELLIDISHEEMDTQMKILEQNLIEWRGSCEQIDDILVIGLKIL